MFQRYVCYDICWFCSQKIYLKSISLKGSLDDKLTGDLEYVLQRTNELCNIRPVLTGTWCIKKSRDF